MKRYLLAGGLSLSLLLATSTLALAQDDTDDVEDSEEVQSLLETIAELEAMIDEEAQAEAEREKRAAQRRESVLGQTIRIELPKD